MKAFGLEFDDIIIFRMTIVLRFPLPLGMGVVIFFLIILYWFIVKAQFAKCLFLESEFAFLSSLQKLFDKCIHITPYGLKNKIPVIDLI